jgi:hypothetical protein
VLLYALAKEAGMKFLLDKDGVPVLEIDGEQYDRQGILDRANSCREQQATAAQNLRSWEQRLKKLDDWTEANAEEVGASRG